MDCTDQQEQFKAQTAAIQAGTVAMYCKAAMFLAFGAAALGLAFL